MKILEHQNGNIELKSSRLLFRNSMLIDLVNSLVWVEVCYWIFFNHQEVYKISNIDYLFVDVENYQDEEGRQYEVFVLKLMDKSSEVIWSYETPEILLGRELSTVIRNTLKIGTNSQSLDAYSEPCPSCKRQISKVAKNCLYCGASKEKSKSRN